MGCSPSLDASGVPSLVQRRRRGSGMRTDHVTCSSSDTLISRQGPINDSGGRRAAHSGATVPISTTTDPGTGQALPGRSETMMDTGNRSGGTVHREAQRREPSTHDSARIAHQHRGKLNAACAAAAATSPNHLARGSSDRSVTFRLQAPNAKEVDTQPFRLQPCRIWAQAAPAFIRVLKAARCGDLKLSAIFELCVHPIRPKTNIQAYNFPLLAPLGLMGLVCFPSFSGRRSH